MPSLLPSTPRIRGQGSAEHGIPRVDWVRPDPDTGRILGRDFYEAWGMPNGRFDPEHLTVYGKSGSGKTYFGRHVVLRRNQLRGSHAVFVMTKKADREMANAGIPIVSDWPPGYKQDVVIYWARAKGISAVHRVPQRVKVKDLMDKLWVKDSNIIVVWDELTYIESDLGLGNELAVFYREGRANGITNVAFLQRPAGVTRLAHSEAGWTVAFPPKDVDDRDRVAEVLGDRQLYRVVLDDLDRTKHEFVLRHDLTGEAVISHLPARRAVSQRRGTGVPSRTR